MAQEDIGLTKRELLQVERERAKFDQALGGIKEMVVCPIPSLSLIRTKRISPFKRHQLGLPVIAVIDSNFSPGGRYLPDAGNDDAMRAISLYCELISGSVLDGLQAEMVASGVDVGELDEPAAEAALKLTQHRTSRRRGKHQ